MPQAFVYTELQISVPFAEYPWRAINPAIREQAGFRNKTWLSGVGTRSTGGFYAFDTIENAARFATDDFPTDAARLGGAYTTRLFGASVVEEASREMQSPFFA